MESEFGLSYNDPIVAQVRAVNAAGLEAEWATSDESAAVKTKPVQMTPAPTRGASTNRDTLHVTWDKMVQGSDATGGSEIIYYSVFLNEDVDPISQTSDNSFLYSRQTIDETEQSFRVAASNIYGTGDKSELSDPIEFGSVPDKLTGLVSQNIDVDNERASIVWDDPGEADLTYEYQVLNKDTNQYADASSIMVDDGDAATFGVEFNCQDLIDQFGYQAGDTIVFRVKAINEVGPSEWAYPRAADMQATSLSMLIL